MGNKQSCCIQASPRNNHRKSVEEKYQVHSEPEAALPRPASSSTNLQHISEREPDDADDDPSNHPTAMTIFLERSKSEIQKNTRSRRRSHYDNHAISVVNNAQLNRIKDNAVHAGVDYGRLSKKFSSCSTIFIDDSTVSQPNLKNTIKTVALAVYFHIKNQSQHTGNRQVNGRILDIFDEKLHPLSKELVPDDYDQRDTEHKTIYRFIRTLFNAAQLTAECAIVALVYLERLLTYAEIEVVSANWKRIVLGAILLASKVWDDQAVWNVDYCQILKDIAVEDMNDLERQFLEMLQFNINVPSSVYAKYYFDLRALADAHDLSFPLEPLSKVRATKLEAMSNICEDKLRTTLLHNLKRSQSLDGLTAHPRASIAILS